MKENSLGASRCAAIRTRDEEGLIGALRCAVVIGLEIAQAQV